MILPEHDGFYTGSLLCVRSESLKNNILSTKKISLILQDNHQLTNE